MDQPSPSDVIPCHGPCRKRFRPASVRMDDAIAALLLAPGEDSGLRWLCPKCRHQVDNDRLAVLLPPELLLLIFRKLDDQSLLQIRSTCRRWKDVVDSSSSLREKFQVEFERNIRMDERYCPANLPPAMAAQLDKSDIINVDAWWPSFGSGLTQLKLSDCDLSLGTLLGMLAETPNLVSLHLVDTYLTSGEEPDANFRLENLRCLSSDTLFDVFIKIFPGLTKLNVKYITDEDEEIMCRLLQSVQGSLVELSCPFTPFIVEQITTMTKLRLITVNSRFIGDGESFVELCRTQPSIEEIRIDVYNALCQVLNDIGRSLPKLKILRVDIDPDVESFGTSFLAEMPLLTRLNITAQSDDEPKLVNFDRCNTSNLLHLQLDYLRIYAGSLQQCLTNCAQIQEIQIGECTLDSWSEIFAAPLKSLCSLIMYAITVNQSATSLPHRQFQSLKRMQIDDCDIPQELLIQLVLQCPSVENLSLTYVESICDGFVQILDRLPQLKQLKLSSDDLTDNSVRFIAENCPHLRPEIESFEISKAGQNRLRAMARPR